MGRKKPDKKKRMQRISRQRRKMRNSKYHFIKRGLYKFLDYDKYKIYMYGGIRKNSASRREPKTVRWIETFMSPEDIMFDVGANVGAYGLVAAANNVKVYAFEPSATTFVILLKNIVKNKFESRIIPLNIPLSGKHSLDYFNYHGMGAGESIHVFGEAIDFRGEKFKPVFRQLALSSTIDDLVFVHGLPCPNHIKLDVDGNEAEILEGARRVLLLPEFKTLCVEVITGVSDKEKIDTLLSDVGLVEYSKIRSRVNKVYIKKSGD